MRPGAKWLVLVVASLACLSGCGPASVTPQPPKAEFVSFALSYGKYTPSRQKLSEQVNDQGLELLFPVISGGLFGQPSETLLRRLSVDGGHFQLTLPNTMDNLATPYVGSELVITPEDTRLLRLATFYAYAQQSSGGGGFLQRTSGNPLILIYVSQPATVKGRAKVDERSFVHDYQLTERGWHWLEFINTGENTVQVRPYSGSTQQIEFSVFVENLISL